jgi:hypothetical protein
MKKGLTEPEFIAAMAEVQAVYDLGSTVANIVGPAYGAAMGDLAIKVFHRDLLRVALGLEDSAYDRGIRLERAEPATRTAPVQARAELGELTDPSADYVLYKKKPWPSLSATEHHKLGLRLREAKTRMTNLQETLADGFAQTTDRYQLATRAKKVLKTLDTLCTKMDERAHADCPTYVDAPPGAGIGPVRSWYYGCQSMAGNRDDRAPAGLNATRPER